MTIGGGWWLLCRELRGSPGRTAVLLLCVTLTAAVGALALAATLFLSREFAPRLRALYPENRIVVRAPSLDVAMLRFEPGRVTAQSVARVRTIAGVERVLPQRGAAFPASAVISVDGSDDGMQTDVILHGVPLELIADDLAEGYDWSWREGEPVPALVSAFFLDLYNLGLAEGMGMPKLNPRAVIGREFPLLLGESSMTYTDGPARTVSARVVGLSANPLLVGLAVPDDAVRAWNREFSDKGEGSFLALHVDLRASADPDQVTAALQEAGLVASAQAEQLHRGQEVVRSVQLLIAAAVTLVLLLSLVGVGSTVLAVSRSRRSTWGLYRASGLSRRGLLLLLLGEAIALSIAAACIGLALAWMVARAAENALGGVLADSALLHTDGVALDGTVLLGTLLGAFLLVALPLLWSALHAIRRQPAALLASLGT